MSDDIPSILSHVSVGTDDLDRSAAFYDAVLPALGIKRFMEVPEIAVAYGKQFPEFWIGKPHDGAPSSPGNDVHIAFIAPSKESVHTFHEAALKAGATEDGPPGPRPIYGEPYYGCFVRDPDGNKIEATFWDESLTDGTPPAA